MRFRLSLLAGAALLIGGLGVLPAGAQIDGVQVPERPVPDRLPERPGDERQRFPEIPLERAPAPAPGLTLPPLPPATSDQRLSTQLRVLVKRIKLTGNTVFSEEELAPIVAPYEGRTLTSEDLYALRQALTRHYIEHGYINSGAEIPDQEVKAGVIEVRIIEGRLTELELSGNDWVRDSYLKKRMMLGSEGALNLKVLQERLQLLQQDRLIDRINAELRPGLRPGESLLWVQVEESRPYEFGTSFNNRRSPSVGGLRGEVYGAMHNLTGFGDSLGARYGVTDGLDDVGAFYSFPFTARDTRFKLYFDRSDSDVVEEPFDRAGIASETETYGVSLSHPFYHTPQRQLLGELLLERRSSETFFFGGMPFCFFCSAFANRLLFSQSTQNGESDVTVLRLVQEWVDRRPNQVLAARSTFSLGLDALGATTNPRDLPDGQFFAWLGQFQWVQRLWDTDNQVLVRADLQLAEDPLLPLEKLGVGGATTVRGYRENLLVRDNGFIGSVEFRFPVFRLPLPLISEGPQDGRVQLAAFYDFGWSENTDVESPDPDTISSLGIGVRWDPHRRIHGELYWGFALREVGELGEGDLQDSGIHFALDIRLF